MYYTTYAHLANNISVARLESLVKSLEAQQLKVHLNLSQMCLELAVPEDKLDWVLNGFITVVFDGFKDVADWSFKFVPSSGLQSPNYAHAA
jgi:hypothetical protein